MCAIPRAVPVEERDVPAASVTVTSMGQYSTPEDPPAYRVWQWRWVDGVKTLWAARPRHVCISLLNYLRLH